jgi:ABC-2 type transport system ATP-binding protein
VSKTPPIHVDHVSKRFDKIAALDDVSLEVGEGEIFGLLGPNGAGKTTLIRTIVDIIKPDTGRVELFGRPFQPDDRDRIGYLPEERGLYQRQEVGKTLEYLGMLKSLRQEDARRRTAEWLERFDLTSAASMKIDQLSKGNQQKVQIAATLVATPAIAILDEPLSGLDPVSARVANGVIRDYAAAGRTVVLSTHQMGLVEALCSRVFMITRGRRVLYGNLRDIKREYSTNTIRVLSNATYAACPLVLRVGDRRSAEEPVDVELTPAATADEFLAWLVADGASVNHFERLSTPLEEIFVRIVGSAGEGTALGATS